MQPSAEGLDNEITVEPHKVSSNQSRGKISLIGSADASVKKVLNAVLALWVVAILVGLTLHRDFSREELKALKQTLPLRWFDNILKRYGTILPVLPFAARWLASALADRRKQRVTPAIQFAEAGCIYVGITIGRLVIYLLHVIGVLHLVLRIFTTVTHTDTKQSEVMSDHLFLGASLTAILTTECVLAYRELMRAYSQQILETARVFFLSLAVGSSGLICLGTILDMFFTARYFHGPIEILGTMVIGWFLFQWPLWLWLLQQ